MRIITKDFIQGIISNGPFTKAMGRATNGTAQPKNKMEWNRFSSWTLICEEVLDTEHNSDWYDGILAELTRRGFNSEQINRMRSFAWKTAGWYNYDMVLWEWCNMDEKDIRRAIDLQLERDIITPPLHAEYLNYIEHPSHIPEDV
jgi:hypothetical protein